MNDEKTLHDQRKGAARGKLEDAVRSALETGLSEEDVRQTVGTAIEDALVETDLTPD